MKSHEFFSDVQMTAGLNIDSWEGLSLLQHSPSCLGFRDVSLLAPEGCSGKQKDFWSFRGQSIVRRCGEASVRWCPCAGRAHQIFRTFLALSRSPPMGLLSQSALMLFQPERLNTGADCGFGAQTFFPSCGVPMKTPHITPTPLSGEAANVDVEP